MKAHIKKYAAVIVLVATIVAFVQYLKHHPDYVRELRHVSPWTVVWVLLLNAAMILILSLITDVTLRLCGKPLGRRETFLLTSYTSLVNFFGPLQSGPGVRGVYLKTKHNVRLRDYTLASLIALGLFAFFSAFVLFVGTRPWWQTAGTLVVVALGSGAVIKLFMQRDRHPSDRHFKMTSRLMSTLLVLSFIQVLITIGWYYVELRAINPHIHFSQAISYAGAANFALFVSITPDAVGIREAFLVFSQHIHHVPTDQIVAANIIDRASYMLFLGLLFMVVVATHARERLQIKQSQ